MLRRRFLAAAAATAGLLAFTRPSPARERSANSPDADTVEQLRRIHLQFKHAGGQQQERWALNRAALALAFDMKHSGMTPAQIRTGTHRALALAKRDFRTGSDPFRTS